MQPEDLVLKAQTFPERFLELKSLKRRPNNSTEWKDRTREMSQIAGQWRVNLLRNSLGPSVVPSVLIFTKSTAIHHNGSWSDRQQIRETREPSPTAELDVELRVYESLCKSSLPHTRGPIESSGFRSKPSILSCRRISDSF
jgi:hypothetical protein